MTLPRGTLRISMLVLSLAVGALTGSVGPASASGARGGSEDRALASTIGRSDAVWLARIADPATVQRTVAIPDGPAFIRMRWRLTALESVAGVAAPSATTLLDEADWRGDLAAWRRCKGDLACADRAKSSRASPNHATLLSRPPRPGERVLVFVRHTADGWEMAAARAFDTTERAAAVKRAWAAR